MTTREKPDVDVTGLAQLQAWTERELPPLEQVRDAVWSVAVPFRESPIRHTFSYLIPGPDGAVVVDPGWDSDEGWAALTDALDVAGIGLAGVSGIVVTHFHPDHVGMAGRLQAATGAWLGMHRRDLKIVEELGRPNAKIGPDGWAEWAGVPAAAIAALPQRRSLFAHDHELSTNVREFDAGDEIRSAAGPLRFLHTPGHTSGHLCLVVPDAGLLLSGDHILPRISPSVAFNFDRSGDPLADYYASLRECERLGDLEVAPAHEYRFRRLPDRARQLIHHHEHRSGEIAAALAAGHRTLWDVAAHISWSRGWDSLDGFNRIAALSETETHLVHLVATGEVEWDRFPG